MIQFIFIIVIFSSANVQASIGFEQPDFGTMLGLSGQNPKTLEDLAAVEGPSERLIKKIQQLLEEAQSELANLPRFLVAARRLLELQKNWAERFLKNLNVEKASEPDRDPSVSKTQIDYDKNKGPGMWMAVGEEGMNGDRHEQPTHTYTNGDRYIGEWVNGKPHGRGTFIQGNGYRYEGQWASGSYEGQGTLTYANGNRYEGQWASGSLEGQGTLTLANGSRYEGQWASGLQEGQGTFSLPDGSRYEGQWKGGQKHGQGIQTYADGNRYAGQWKGGLRQGHGIMTDTNGNRYEGQWEGGERHGCGLIYTNGERYKGQWLRGVQQGALTCACVNCCGCKG